MRNQSSLLGSKNCQPLIVFQFGGYNSKRISDLKTLEQNLNPNNWKCWTQITRICELSQKISDITKCNQTAYEFKFSDTMLQNPKYTNSTLFLEQLHFIIIISPINCYYFVAIGMILNYHIASRLAFCFPYINATLRAMDFDRLYLP